MGNKPVKPLGNVGAIRHRFKYKYLGSTPASKLGGLDSGKAVVDKITELDLPKKAVHLFITDKCFVVCTSGGDTAKVLEIKDITYYFQHPTKLNIIGVFETLSHEHVTVCHCFQGPGNAKKLAQALDVATLSLTVDDEERRFDGDALYTKKEFEEFYGKDWEVEWNAAAKPAAHGITLNGFNSAVSSDDYDFEDSTPAERAASRAATLTRDAAKGPARSPSISSARIKLSIEEREKLYDSPFAKPGTLVDYFEKVQYYGQIPAENNAGGRKAMHAARQRFKKSGAKPKMCTIRVYENLIRLVAKKGSIEDNQFLVQDVGFTYEFPGENIVVIIVDDSVRQSVVYLMFGVTNAAKGGAAGLVRSLNTRKKLKTRGASGDSRMSNEPVYDSVQAFEATYYGMASFSSIKSPDKAAQQCFNAIKKRGRMAEGVFLIVTRKSLRCISALSNNVIVSWSPETICYFSSFNEQLVVLYKDETTGLVDGMLLSATNNMRAKLIKQVFQNTWFSGMRSARPSGTPAKVASSGSNGTNNTAGGKGMKRADSSASAASGYPGPGPRSPDDVSQDFVANGPRTPAPESLFKRQIHRRDLIPEKVMGAGQFGKVYRAHMNAYKSIPAGKVAVKVLKDVKSNADRNEFIHEAEVMLETNHPNLVNMLGVAVQQRPWLMALDLCDYGDLQKLLKVAKMKTVSLTSKEQILICAEIAKGMAYMEKINFVHCDLAARNVLVGSDNQFKVADFGMTRRLRNRPRWRGNQGMKVAIRWASIEVLDDRVFTTKADVWAYGVVMWEVFAYGVMPYPGLKNADVHKLLRSGGVMKAPPGTPPAVYQTMRTTWKKDPPSRPAFKDLVSELQGFLRTSTDPPVRDIGLTITESGVTDDHLYEYG
eukprot:m.181199 g.181199  ORF g.181199 m.181199 type:complete len:881 (+) comp15189_c0_seq1:77-2719(+)